MAEMTKKALNKIKAAAFTEERSDSVENYRGNKKQDCDYTV